MMLWPETPEISYYKELVIRSGWILRKVRISIIACLTLVLPFVDCGIGVIPMSSQSPIISVALTSNATSISTLSTTPRATTQLALIATHENGTTSDITALAEWTSANSTITAIGNASNNKGLATGGKVGSNTLTGSYNGFQRSVDVTVSAAKLIIMWGGWNVSGYGRYATDGTLDTTFQTDSTTRDLRGLLTVPGGFIGVGQAAVGTVNYSEYFSNAGTQGTTLLEQGSWEAGPQAVTKLSTGIYLVPQYDTSVVNVYDSSGKYVVSFGSGQLNRPYQAVELADGRVIISSFSAGKMVAYTYSGTTFTLSGDFASGFTAPFAMDYCPNQDQVLMSDFTEKKVYRCTSAGVCTVLANHGYVTPLAIRSDINTGDCAFYLGYRDNAAVRNKIARFDSNGTVTSVTWATMPILNGAATQAKVYGIDFEILQ